MNRTAIHEVLRRLMFEQTITASELARRAKLPQQTLQRIICGGTRNPHPSSLQALAHYFELTIEQLKGVDPIPKLDEDIDSTMISTAWHSIPLIDWQDIPQHPDLSKKYPTVLSNANVQPHSFAILMNDASMTPLFPIDSTLIIDPDIAITDRCYVVAQLHHSNQPHEIVFRWLLMDGQHYYLKAISLDFAHCALTKIQQQDHIVGVLAQMQCDYAKNGN